MKLKNTQRRRSIGVAFIAALVIASVLAVPSFGAPSFLTKEAAGKVYLTQKAARGVYLTRKAASATYATNKDVKKNYLTKERADETFLRQSKIPNEAGIAITSKTVPFGPVKSTTAVDVPGSFTSFKMVDDGFVVVTLSGTSLCKATANGTPCPVSILIDNQVTGFGKANFDLSSSVTPAPKGSVHTLVSTQALTKGNHVASIAYAGSTDASVEFTLSNYNLVVQTYPGSLDLS